MFADKHLKNAIIGKTGENIASDLLIRAGWEIIERNYRRKNDELDIISLSPNKTLVFIEVKTLVINMGSQNILNPEDNLTTAKRRKIARTCEFYANAHPQLVDDELGWRIDLIAIDLDLDEKVLDIRHYENI